VSPVRYKLGVYIPEDGILHSHSQPLQWRRNVFPVRYKLGIYISEVGILHSLRRENLKCYISLSGWTV
jgi:hypothetical protein